MKENKKTHVDEKIGRSKQQTEAILDVDRALPPGDVPIPCEQCIEDAKDWVDEHEV